ncbi:4-hydroxy-tetrahydrodipicolinate reductase [Lentibacillus saliphilus]|uniref:4-hydroxy-tetrahydrodipicolinate reductase n=1 Tax=Lentibacillus saliphilus TaxID=2737028 RepID=UPI001C2F3DA7|nr:4-hydroxy-tetrahydrodipicolinate reductase [Lentibacillus saliphilus]
MTIRLILAGPRGKMGSETINLIHNRSDLQLVACIDKASQDRSTGVDLDEVVIYEDAEKCFQQCEADVFIDFTVADACFKHSKLALKAHVHPVIGTSGLSNEQMMHLSQIAETHRTGGIIVPNFSIGALLMMHFAKQAATFFSSAEIIEKHHDQKLDAPSGTALRTAEMMRQTVSQSDEEQKRFKGDRSASTASDIPIHSVRLPGLLAHHEVVFGGLGEALTIKHDSFNRQSYMNGILWAIHYVVTIDHLAYGLDDILK